MNQQVFLKVLVMVCLGFGACRSHQDSSSGTSSVIVPKAKSSTLQEEEWVATKMSKEDKNKCGKAVIALCSILEEQGKGVEGGIFKRRLLAAPLACQEELRQVFNKVHGDVKSVDMSVCFIEIMNSMPLSYFD